MRKIICYIAVSLDGYIAKADGAVDWLDRYHDADYGYEAFNQRIDTVLMGYGSYIKSLDFGDTAFPEGKLYYIFSRQPRTDARARIQFPTESPVTFCASLRQSEGKDIWLLGGGQLLAHFLEEGLVDELMVYVMPEMIGRGIALFPSSHPGRWQLIDHKAYPNGVVFSHYSNPTPVNE